MVKKGDTLVEVALAIGIFSMIAVSVTAIMNSSTSGSQTSLETTLAREEIDVQAEALRFIHSSYSASQDNADTRYKDLWQAISKDKAIELANNDNDKKILEYQPESCNEVYDEDIFKNGKTFAINPLALSKYTNTDNPKKNDVLISSFSPTQTYPRLFGSTAEGIYIIAVPDKNTTTLVAGVNKQPAFYDFYIRSCWYGTDADNPSTISTVVRLYNPDAVVALTPTESGQQSAVQVVFNGNNNNGGGQVNPISAKPGGIIKLPQSTYKWTDSTIQFVGWSTDPNSVPEKALPPGSNYTIPGDISQSKINFYAVWDSNTKYWLDLNTFLRVKGKVDKSNTSGVDGFYADVIINGKKVSQHVKDFYQEVTSGSRVSIILTEWPKSYYLVNYNSICNGTTNSICRIQKGEQSYTISLEIIKDSLSQEVNSNGKNAINIEPIWEKK